MVTFKYQEVSNSGAPRFPVFLRERHDVTWAEVKENAKTKKPFSEKKKLSFKLKVSSICDGLFSHSCIFFFPT